MVGSANQLVTGKVGGALQLWTVDHTHSPPSVSLTKSMEVDGGIFSAAFDSKMELVSVSYMHIILPSTAQLAVLLLKMTLFFPPGCGWHFIWLSVVHQLD